MVLAEKNTEDNCIRLRTSAGGRRSRAASPNGHISDDSNVSDDSQHDSGMRVGHDYQAVVPEMISSEACPESVPERALLVWSPCPQVQDTKLDEYITLAKEKYGYNAEQALGMLFWHKYDVEKALSDLPNFTPFPDEWTMEDKVLFEQAFQFHGKSFSRIRQMLPDKSIASLVKYYYSWKKTRCRTSLMDRQARKLANQREDNSDVGSEAASENESDMEVDGKEPKEEGGSRMCSNCSNPVSSLSSTPKGPLCQPCYSHYRRTGNLRAPGGSGPMRKHESGSSRHNPLRGKRRPPRGMHLNYDDLVSIATGPPKQGETILRAMDSEVVSLKRQVQNNKQIIGQLKHKTSAGIDEFKPSEGSTRINSRWTNDELLLAVQGVRKYGHDFKAIAELIGNKTEVHVRSFFVNYRRRYNLDAVLHEYEAEFGVISSPSSTTSNSGDVTEPSKDDAKSSSLEGSMVPSSSSGQGDPKGSSSPPSSTNAIQAPPPLLSKSTSSNNSNNPSSSTASTRGTNVAQNFLRNVVSRSMLQQPPPLVRPTPTTVAL